MPSKLDALTAELAAVAEHYDLHSCWPQRSLDILSEAGAWKWIIPKKWGGVGLGGSDLVEAYEAVARGCVATALILTQRDGACDLMAQGENDALKKRLLPAHAKAQRFTSVGIAQLTTSKGSSRKPPMRAKRDGRKFILDGVMPWVTGAEQCDEIVTGAELDDGRQLLACVSCEDPGVAIEPAMKLMALGASATSRVRCRAVVVKADDVIRKPAQAALSGRAPVKPLVVSSVGIGLAGALHDRIRGARVAAPLKQAVKPLLNDYRRVRKELIDASARISRNGEAVDARGLRVAVNELVCKLALAYLTLSKGTGYTQPHPAERLLREAMLFLVWSAPEEVQVETLHGLLGGGLQRPVAEPVSRH